MAITQPTIDDFQDTTVMRVIRKVVNYLVGLVPKINDEIDNLNMINEEALAQQNAKITANTEDIASNTQDIATNKQNINANTQNIAANTQNIATNRQDIDANTQSISTIEANVEALNKELPSEIRIEYDSSTGNFNIDYVKEDGDVLTSNTVVIVSGSTGEVTIVQNTSGISINGITLQSATTAQPGLMTPALVSSLNNVNDTTNDHTTMLNAQAQAITELDDRVDTLEQAGGVKSLVSNISEVMTYNQNSVTVLKDFEIQYIVATIDTVSVSGWVTVSAGVYNGRAVYLAGTSMSSTYTETECYIHKNYDMGEVMFDVYSIKKSSTLINTENLSPTGDGSTKYYYRIRA